MAEGSGLKYQVVGSLRTKTLVEMPSRPGGKIPVTAGTKIAHLWYIKASAPGLTLRHDQKSPPDARVLASFCDSWLWSRGISPQQHNCRRRGRGSSWNHDELPRDGAAVHGRLWLPVQALVP